MAVSMVRVKFDAPAEAGNGLIQLFLAVAGAAETPMKTGQVRGEFDRLGHGGYGLIEDLVVAHGEVAFQEGEAEMVPAPGALRIDLDGLAVDGDRLVEFLLLPQDVTEIAMGRGQ